MCYPTKKKKNVGILTAQNGLNILSERVYFRFTFILFIRLMYSRHASKFMILQIDQNFIYLIDMVKAFCEYFMKIKKM